MKEILITSSVLVLVILVIRAIFKGKIDARLQYALWAIVLLRLLIPFSFGSSPISIMNFIFSSPQEISSEEANSTPEGGSGENVILPVFDAGFDTAQIDQPFRESQAGGNASKPSFDDEKENQSKLDFDVIVKVVWIVGTIVTAVAFIVFNTVFYVRLRKSRRLFDYKCGCRAYITDEVCSPCLVGIFRPSIYLTEEAAKGSGLKYVIEHELTHKRHLDHVWSFLRAVCVCVYWFDPFVWISAVLSKRDCELACDESTVRRLGEEHRISYGRTLVDMISSAHRIENITLLATTMVCSKKGLKERIYMIAKKRKMLSVTASLIVLVILISAGCTFTGAEKPKTEGVAEWLSELVSGEIENAEIHYGYGAETKYHILSDAELEALSKTVDNVTDDDVTAVDNDPIKLDGAYRLSLMIEGKLYLFKAAEEKAGSVVLIFETEEDSAFGGNLLIKSAELSAFLISADFEEESNQVPELPAEDVVQSNDDEVNSFEDEDITDDMENDINADDVDIGIELYEVIELTGYDNPNFELTLADGIATVQIHYAEMWTDYADINSPYEEERIEAERRKVIAEAIEKPRDIPVDNVTHVIELPRSTWFPGTDANALIGTADGRWYYVDLTGSNTEGIPDADEIETIRRADVEKFFFGTTSYYEGGMQFVGEDYIIALLTDGSELVVCQGWNVLTDVMIPAGAPLKDTELNSFEVTVNNGETLLLSVIGKQEEEYKRFGVREIAVYKGAELYQTILIKEAIEADGVDGIDEGYSEAVTLEAAAALVDVNFDGYLDIQVGGWVPNNSIPYYYWYWNPESGYFEYAFCLHTERLDSELKQIIAWYKVENGLYYTDYFRVDEDNELILADRKIEDVRGN